MRSRKRIALSIAILVTGGVLAGLVESVWLHRAQHIVMQGSVIKADADVKKQSPIANVQISVQGAAPPIGTESNFSGFFKVVLPIGARPGETVFLRFRHPDYRPIELPEVIGKQLYVVSLTPIPKHTITRHGPMIRLSNIRVRYSTQIENEANIGSEITTFEIPNQGNVPCDGYRHCSPDGRWKANVGSASLDAGDGNVFENARVSCIAGPCPFTRIISDRYSGVSRTISVSVLDWSDTTTFLMQGEVFRREISDSVREMYPVIFGDSINFSLPPPAEGTTLEAEVNSIETVFPLGPNPSVPWADCNVQAAKNQSKNYRCELRQGYQITSR
ncbi:MAG TPA: carboxypeptidase regulatory-like domain-containing protein [Candidatus Dormibacteraeota bacterium]|nr:carboxypeptidase regulatory-like domain-containing protein [Candidatus Dormibacteraeota bacterium]